MRFDGAIVVAKQDEDEPILESVARRNRRHTPPSWFARRCRRRRRCPLRNQSPVTSGGAAAKAGVRVNDTIAAIDGNASPAAHEDLVDIIRAIGRPVVIGFHRSGGGGKEAKGAGARAQEPGPFQRAQDAARRKMDEIKGPPQVRRRSQGAGRPGRCACVLTT